MPTALDNGQRSPRKLLAAVVRKLVAALRQGSERPPFSMSKTPSIWMTVYGDGSWTKRSES
jgi:hypothetical protein